MKKKNITIDDLAVMVQRGFLETAKKEEMDKRFNEVDGRFEAIDKRFEAVDRRFDRLEKKLDRVSADHEERIEILEADMKEIKKVLI